MIANAKATGPVIEVWIFVSHPSYGNPPPAAAASAGCEITMRRTTANPINAKVRQCNLSALHLPHAATAISISDSRVKSVNSRGQ
jgi:hypothetical protein